MSAGVTRAMIKANGISYTVDDALNGRTFEVNDTDWPHATLVGFQCGFEQLIVCVYSYLGVRLPDDECIELAEDYLREIGWLKTDDPEVHVYRWASLPAGE